MNNNNPMQTVDNNEKHENEGKSSDETKAKLGSGPSGPIPDGGNVGEEKQEKEKTGKDTNMGGSDGGKAGMGIEKNKEDSGPLT